MQLYNEDNMTLDFNPRSADMIVADYVYENTDFSWVDKYWRVLKPSGVIIAFSDWHSSHRYRCYIEDNFSDSNFVNDIKVKTEWGNFPKDRMHQVHDDILIYAKGNGWKFHSDRIQVPKATAKTKLNPSGRQTKTATSWIDDITLLTTSPERIKLDGKCVRWQKPVALLRRVMIPFIDRGDVVVDPFMGLGTAGVVAQEWGLDYYGIEIDERIYNLAKVRLGY